MMNTKIALLTGALVLAGCQGAPPAGRPGPYVKPGLIMIPVDQAQHYELSCRSEAVADAPPGGYPVTDVRSVQTESQVSAIQLNRYADPARPDQLMHEAHVVYRRESPRWRLQPSTADQQVIVGPTLTDGRGEVRPVVSQELDAYLRDQRSNLQRQQQMMGQITEGLRQLADQQQQLAKEFAKLQSDQSRQEPARIGPREMSREPQRGENLDQPTFRVP